MVDHVSIQTLDGLFLITRFLGRFNLTEQSFFEMPNLDSVREKQRRSNHEQRRQTDQERFPIEGVVTIGIEHRKSSSKSKNQCSRFIHFN